MPRNFLVRLRQLVLPAHSVDDPPLRLMRCVKIKPPSEYPAPGVARWNTYPFVELSDSSGQIRLGQYRLSDSEAIETARNLLSAIVRKSGDHPGLI